MSFLGTLVTFYFIRYIVVFGNFGVQWIVRQPFRLLGIQFHLHLSIVLTDLVRRGDDRMPRGY